MALAENLPALVRKLMANKGLCDSVCDIQCSRRERKTSERRFAESGLIRQSSSSSIPDKREEGGAGWVGGGDFNVTYVAILVRFAIGGGQEGNLGKYIFQE